MPFYDPVVLPVPRDQAGITADWFGAALSASYSDISVQEIRVEALPHLGFMCDIYRVTPTWRSAPPALLPASFIVKIPPTDPGSRHVGAMLDAWSREGAFYREVAPQSRDLPVPACFYIGEDRPSELWVLILEELAADGVTDSIGATSTQAALALEALAAMHASWWQSPSKFNWMPGFDGRGVGGLQPMWLDAIPTFLERYGDLIPAETAMWLTTFAPRLRAWSDKAATEPLTIVHADYRSDNLIFSGDQVTIIDWQTALRGPAAMDVSSFLATSMDTDVRRGAEDPLVDGYLACLAKAGVAVDRDWFDTSLDENLLWWMGQFANNLAHLHPDAEAQKRLDLMVTRTYQMAADRNVGRLLG